MSYIIVSIVYYLTNYSGNATFFHFRAAPSEGLSGSHDLLARQWLVHVYQHSVVQCISQLISVGRHSIRDHLKLRLEHVDKRVRKTGGQTFHYWQASCGLALSLRRDHSVGRNLICPTRLVISRASAYRFVTSPDYKSAYRSPKNGRLSFFRPDRMTSAGGTDPAGTQQPVSMMGSRAVCSIWKEFAKAHEHCIDEYRN